MRHFHWIAFLCGVLLAVACCQSVWAEAAAKADDAQKNDAEQNEAQQEESKPVAPAKKAAKKKSAARTSKGNQLFTPQELYVPEAAPRPNAAVVQPPRRTRPIKQPMPAAQRPAQQPANPQVNPPRRATLSTAASYRLQSMGGNVHLSPAMQWHLNRARGISNVAPEATTAAASAAPGQGANKFYPGVSRLPPQKPFADIEPEPSGLERYWPLLLEGRQDPNTGQIIWRLP